MDYTKSAIEVYEHAKWKGYKFKTIRNLDSGLWLDLLFKRPITDFDIKNLTSFIKKRKNIELKQKHNVPLDINDKASLLQTYIGQDGYIYFYKMIPAPECKNPQEKARLEKMLEDIKANKEQREIDDLKQMARRSYIKNYYKLEGRKLIKK